MLSIPFLPIASHSAVSAAPDNLADEKASWRRYQRISELKDEQESVSKGILGGGTSDQSAGD